ncbi:MAG: NAD-dependent epimerase/dehydratase family protein [Candidatus Aenigmarchaeota archaeon]|nr:NAD-dependent epimerase/dehydratase family protein [Candidatus Aenigmarchaeota archaeon]
MNILVTGCAGFVGSHLVEELQKKHNVIAFDNFSGGKEKNLEGLNVEIINGDIRKISDLENIKTKPDVIIHLAAIVDTTRYDSEMMDVNVKGTLNILEYARRIGADIVNTSSAAIYGDKTAAIKESDSPDPQSLYAQSKLIAEKLAKAYHDNFNMNIVCLRLFNVYGPKEQHKGKATSMVTKFLDSVLKGEDILIYGDGKQRRDFIYVKDVAKAFALCAEKTKDIKWGIYNAGSGEAISFTDLVNLLKKLSGKDGNVTYSENPLKVYQKFTMADITKIKELGFEPIYSLEKGIKEYIESN